MRQDKGDISELGPEGGVNEIKYDVPEHAAQAPVDAVPDDDLEYTGENGDGQEIRVPNGWS